MRLRRCGLLLGVIILAVGLPPASPRLSSHRKDTVRQRAVFLLQVSVVVLCRRLSSSYVRTTSQLPGTWY